jgi:para-aminobenzoate synthetase component 1
MNQAAKDTIKRMNELGNQKIPFVFILDFDLARPKVYQLNELDDKGILVDIAVFQNIKKPEFESKDFHFRKTPVSFQHYKEAFDLVMKHILHGDSFLLNLTMQTRIDTNLTLKEIFLRSKAKYKLLYKDNFVVFSPEPFIRISGNEIFSYPMKGTIDAGIENAKELLLNDPKEISEHNTIVDLIRNDLSMVAEKVRVKNFRYVEEIQTHEKVLLQSSSEIFGKLNEDWNSRIGDIIFKLLPAGSISGAPKKKTIEVIREAEKFDRGYFTGIFGYFSGEELHSAVMIRFIEKQGGQLIFKSGGGITNHSNAETEYQELIDKVYVPVI